MEATQAIVSIFAITVVIGLPMMAFSVRFALKPALEAWLKVRESYVRPSVPPPAAELEAIKLRIAALEAVWEHRLGAGTLKPSVSPTLVD
jgi:hypothetical protein